MGNSVTFKGSVMNLFIKILSILLSLTILLLFCACNKENEEEFSSVSETTTIAVITEEVVTDKIFDYESHKTEGSQVGLIVDSWLKIVNIGETDGVLTVLVRNVANFDVQFATLTVKEGNTTAEFSITTLTAGASMLLKCENGIMFNENAKYHSWKVTEKVIFKEKLSCHSDIFEIIGNDGSVTIKNISKKDIKGDIYIYYKTVIDGIFVEGTTYRVRVDGLEKGEKKSVPVQHFQKDNSRIMFVTYA